MARGGSVGTEGGQERPDDVQAGVALAMAVDEVVVVGAVEVVVTTAVGREKEKSAGMKSLVKSALSLSPPSRCS